MDCRHTIDGNVIGSPCASCVGKTTTIMIRGGLFSPLSSRDIIICVRGVPRMDKVEKDIRTAWHTLEIGEVLRDLQVHENG